MMSPPVGTVANLTGAPMPVPNPPGSGGVVSSPRSSNASVHIVWST
jgi:hypothetical protein